MRQVHVSVWPWLLAPLVLGLVFAATTGGCGGDDDGGGGQACGAELTGVELCVQAQVYINCGPCVADPTVDHSAFSIDVDDCENDGTLLCANCIRFQKQEEGCILADDCAAECVSARQ